MPKRVWDGKDPKEYVSKSEPFLLEPAGAASIPPFVPMVWDLTASDRKKADEAIVLAAQNVGQMVRENPDRGLLLLQSLPKDADARTAFIDAVKEALKGTTSWEIAKDDDSKSVLTLYNAAHLEEVKPTGATAPALAGNPESYSVNWFSSKIKSTDCFCVGNMQYKSKVSAGEIQKDYEAFNNAYYDSEQYNSKKNDFPIIFAGALGAALKNDTLFSSANVFVPEDAARQSTTSSMILDIMGPDVEPRNATATPRSDYNRRDAAVYPGEKGFTADDMWDESDIPKALATDTTFNISEVGVKITEENKAQFKKSIHDDTLHIFSYVNQAANLKENRDNLAAIFKNIVRSFRAAYDTPVTIDKIPTNIKLVIPVHWGSEKSGHYTPLCLDIKLDKDEFVNLINGSDWTDETVFSPENFKKCVTATEAHLIESTPTSYLTQDNKIQLETMLKQFLNDGVSINDMTPFLQRNLDPKNTGVDCGPITAKQGRRFLKGKDFLKVEKQFVDGMTTTVFPNLSMWNNKTWDSDDDKKRKQYAAESFRIGLELRRKFLQFCGAGAAPDNVKAEKSELNKKGYRNPDELARVRESKTAYKQLTDGIKKYDDRGKQVLGQLPNINEQTLLYSRSGDKGDILSAKKSSRIIADLMMHDLFSKGFDKVTISTSPHNEAMFRSAALRAGFKLANISFGEVKVESAAKNEQAQNLPPEIANFMKKGR